MEFATHIPLHPQATTESATLDLFERLKFFISQSDWQAMLALASPVVAAAGWWPLPGDWADLSPDRKAELSLRHWLSVFRGPGCEQRRQRAIAWLTPSGTAHIIGCLDRLADRAITQLINAGRARRFSATGLIGAELKIVDAEIWRAVERIDVDATNSSLILAGGTVIGGVRTTEPPQERSQQDDSLFKLQEYAEHQLEEVKQMPLLREN